MGFFSKLGKTAKRAVAYDSLKAETMLVKNSAEVFIDGIKEAQSKNKESGDPAKQTQFKDLNPEEITESAKLYKKLLGLFLLLDCIGIVYLILGLIKHDWMLSLLILFFILVCGALSFRFHFYLTVIKEKNLNLSLSAYFSQFMKGSPNN